MRLTFRRRTEEEKLTRRIAAYNRDALLVLKREHRDPDVWKTGGGWGSHVSWNGTDRMADGLRRVYGHGGQAPQVGDLLVTPLGSPRTGRTGVFRFVNVELCDNPRDMWVGSVADVRIDDQPFDEADATATPGYDFRDLV